MTRRFLLLATVFLAIPALAQMHPQYSSYVTNPTSSTDGTKLYASATIDGSTTCTVPPGCTRFTHTGKVYLTIGGVGGWVIGSPVEPEQYLGVSNAQTITASPGVVYALSSTQEVYCTGIGGAIALVTVSAQVEVAFTQVRWPGSPAPSCTPNGPCIYSVHWDCTAGTVPPDYPVGSVKSGNYVGIATDIRWRALSPCIRFIVAGIHGPWACYAGAFPINSWQVALNDPAYPPYACTHNP
jgi:hypothetical protein